VFVPGVGVIVPLDAIQVTEPPAGVVVAVKFIVCPSVRPPRVGVIVTLLLLLLLEVTVIAAVAVLVPSATAAAVSVTNAGVGTVAGAVYVTGVPDAVLGAESAPQVAALQPDPENVQFTPLFAESFATVAVNVAVVLMGTVAEVAERVTETVATAVTVIVAAAVFVPSATEIAVSVTTGGVGTAAGAV
jgi:hypothetical protein